MYSRPPDQHPLGLACHARELRYPIGDSDLEPRASRPYGAGWSEVIASSAIFHSPSILRHTARYLLVTC